MSEDALRAYLKEIAEFPLLTRRGERALAERSSRGDAQARRQLVEANLRLVVAIARGFRDKGVRMIDLIQEGNVGLMRAVETFDGSSGVAFATFATPIIRQYIQHSVGDQ